MKPDNVEQISLDKITNNPWRNIKLFPLDDEHVAEIRDAIREANMFHQTPTGRWVDGKGKFEIACGHARVAAARKAKLGSIPVVVGDYDDDQMLRLMVDENALQAGGFPGAVMNEVAAIMEHLIGTLMSGQDGGRSVHDPILKEAFTDKGYVDRARGLLLKRMNDPDVEVPIGHVPILRYLGHGDIGGSRRTERQIRDAIGSLKQTGLYDKIIDDAARKHAPMLDAISVGKKIDKPKTPRKRPEKILDERTAHLFKNDHQYAAFREAVTSSTARKVIPVDQQLALAKEIMDPMARAGFSKKQVGAPYIRKMVQDKITEGAKAQRAIDKEERDRYLAEQLDRQIDDILINAKGSLRSLLSSINAMIEIIQKHPGLEKHPRLGGFSEQLDRLVNAVKQLSKAIK